VQNISFNEGENYTRIQIEGSETLEPPFYKLLSDPLRIVIDIPNIDLKQTKGPVKINNGTVTEVLATQFDDKGRIEIGLDHMANYNIFQEDKNLIIDIEKVKEIVAEVKAEVKDEEATKDKETELAPPELKGEKIPPIAGITSTPETPKKAKEVLNFLFDQRKDLLTFNIIADGKIGNYDAFKLDAPTRLVLDIWEVNTRYPKNSIKIRSPFIQSIRIGRHPDKLRFVFECHGARLPSYQINRVEEKLIISFGKVPQPSEPQIILPEKIAKKTSAPRAQLKDPIEFKQMDGKSRIVVTLTDEPEFEVITISKKMIAVNIKNAFIPKHLKRSLDTSAFDSAVKYIDLKNLRVGKTEEAQILIRLGEEVPFETIKEGKTLFIDVEKPKKIEGKIEAVPEAKKEEIAGMAVKKEEAKKEEAKKEEVKKEEEKPVSELKKPEVVSPPVEEKPAPQPEVTKKGEEEKQVIEERLVERTCAGRRVSLDFKDADIKNILRLIAEVSDFNIIAGDDVTGKITMRLVDVPWDQALDVILRARSLGMSKVGNVIRIAPLESIKKETLADLDAKRAKEQKEDLVSDLIPINYASAKEILPQVKGILSDRGDVRVDERTNILIVKDIARNIVAAKELVKWLDTKTPQVLIEARIVEANLSFQKDLGISWGFMASTGTGQDKTFTVGSEANKVVNLPATTAGASILEFLFTSAYGLKNLDITLSAYESKGEAKIISSPKIATLDNKEASIEQGLRIPYTKLTADGTPTEEFIEANLKLTVTPHVTNDGHIKMKIMVKKDEPDYSKTSIYGTPRINKKESTTEVLVKDNGVIAIAGIYTINKNETGAGVPLFNKVPVLGWLFKKELKTDDRTDLLIFISPKIFKGEVL
jgi:type IV pilus assembly protein PilQ